MNRLVSASRALSATSGIACLRRTFAPSTFSAPQSPLISFQKRWASKAAGGSTRNGRDSNPKYRGLKKNHGQLVYPGNILVRQKGSKYHAAEGVGKGRDFTLFARVTGYMTIVRERRPKSRHFSPGKNWFSRKYITVLPDKPANLIQPRQDIR